MPFVGQPYYKNNSSSSSMKLGLLKVSSKIPKAKYKSRLLVQVFKAMVIGNKKPKLASFHSITKLTLETLLWNIFGNISEERLTSFPMI